MGETLLGNPYGLTPDELLKANQVLTAGSVIRKNLYVLDLWMKGRKPDVVPKVGDKVKIKSLEWYEKWSDEYGNVTVSYTFTTFMKDYCGRTMTISEVTPSGNYKFKGVGYCFSLDMFEEVYPMLEQISSTFPKIDLNSKIDLSDKPITLPPYQLKAGELIVANTTVGSMIEDTAKRIAAYTSVQGLTAKPKLKQVKTTRLIKLKKL